MVYSFADSYNNNIKFRKAVDKSLDKLDELLMEARRKKKEK